MKRRSRATLPSAAEVLEIRQYPSASSVFVLDYTPDYRSMGSLHETFYNVRLGNGNVPVMFDFDGNGRLTGNDVTVAANEITSRVRSYFKNYLSTTNLTIIGGDLNASKNQLLGDQWLRQGLRSDAVGVSVMYFGGRGGGEYGIAPLALNGYNVEGFGEVYVRSIAIDLVNRNPRTTPAEFALNVASTAAHELGHMMGLRHATSGPANNLMVPGRSRANNHFPNQATYTEGGVAQNAHHELWYSLRGQKTYYQVASYGVPDTGFNEAALHDHEHDCEHEHELEHELGFESEHSDPAGDSSDSIPFLISDETNAETLHENHVAQLPDQFAPIADPNIIDLAFEDFTIQSLSDLNPTVPLETISTPLMIPVVRRSSPDRPRQGVTSLLDESNRSESHGFDTLSPAVLPAVFEPLTAGVGAWI
jgi:hypothetical protein